MALLFVALAANICGIFFSRYLDSGKARVGTLVIGKPNSWFMVWTGLSFH